MTTNHTPQGVWFADSTFYNMVAQSSKLVNSGLTNANNKETICENGLHEGDTLINDNIYINETKSTTVSHNNSDLFGTPRTNSLRYQLLQRYRKSEDGQNSLHGDTVLFLSSPDLYNAPGTSIQHQYSIQEQKNLKNEPVRSWVNLAAVFMLNVIFGYHVLTFGVYYVEFTRAFETTKANAGAVGALHGFTSSIIGLFASVVIKLYGCKLCAFTGCLITTSGLLVSSFAPNVQFMYVSYGIVSGFGVAFMSLAAMTITQLSFDKHRALATSISVIGIPAGNLIAPILTTYLIQTLGWRGALIIHSGIMFNSLVFIMLMKPPLTTQDNNQSDKSISVMIKSLFDFSVLRNKPFLCYTLSSICIRFNLYAYFDHTISRAVFYGIDLQRASLIITYLCICSLISRSSISIVTKFVNINPLALCIVIGITQAIASFAVTLSTNYMWIVGCTIVFGLAQGGSIIQVLLCVVKLAGVDNFARTRAVWNMFVSVAAITTTPITGWVFDITQNYNIPFYMAGTMGFIGSLGTLAVLIAVSFKDRYKHTANVSNKQLPDTTQHTEMARDVQTTRIRTFTF